MMTENAYEARDKALRGVLDLADEYVGMMAQLEKVSEENLSMQRLLRERKEREPKGCELCVPNGDGDTCELTHREDMLGTHVVYINPKGKRIICMRDGFVLASKEVGFCPMCGRPL